VGFIVILLKLESFLKEIMAFLLRSIAYKGGDHFRSERGKSYEGMVYFDSPGSADCMDCF
jgi:hypothetical protein